MTAKKIDITPELEAKIEESYVEYLKRGTSTAPANRPEVEETIRRIYAREGIKEIPVIYWADGLQAALTELKNSGVTSTSTGLWGAMDLPYYSQFDFAAKHIDPNIFSKKDQEELDDMMKMTQVWFWWPFTDCLVMDTPSTLLFDEAGELHCENGPAIEFRNGEQLFYIHGHLVNKKVVMEKETITIEDISAEGNDEVRRIMIDAYGPEKYAKELGSTVIDSDVSCGQPRFLVKVKDGSLWLLGTDGGTLVDGKPRVYWMPSYSGVATCAEAHSRIAGFDEKRISDRC
jgi:hypothetical protein